MKNDKIWSFLSKKEFWSPSNVYDKISDCKRLQRYLSKAININQICVDRSDS